MWATVLRCPHCGRADFKTEAGLAQHQIRNKWCLNQSKLFLGSNHGRKESNAYLESAIVLDEHLIARSVNISRLRGKLPQRSSTFNQADVPDEAFLLMQLQGMSFAQVRDADENRRSTGQRSLHTAQTNQDVVENITSESEDGQFNFAINQGSSESEGNDSALFDRTMIDSFGTFVKESKYMIPHTKRLVNAAKLMHKLRHTKASMETYESIMEWHFEANDQLRITDNFTRHRDYISRKRLFTELERRHVPDATKWMNVKEAVLPHSRAKVKIVVNDAKAVMAPLLTGPRIVKEDYLFYNDDPFCGPPDDLDHIGGLNTGEACRQTYDYLITHPNSQILLPVIFYIGAANTGQFADLPVTAAKFSLGIFTRTARDKPHLWRALGCMPKVHKHKSTGNRLLRQPNHIDAAMALNELFEHEGTKPDKSAFKAQDLHTMLSVVLKSYVELQNSGFIWHFRHGRKAHKNVEFMLFTPFLRVDSDEAGKLCGKCTSRGQQVAQLCRHCECPNQDTDKVLPAYPFKAQQQMSDLIEQKDLEALRSMSQQCMHNAFYSIRFGSHNDRGIHGACPAEMLHALLLGMFKYVRDCFFHQIGETSDLGEEINGYAMKHGYLIHRNSGRDFPKTTFANGITRGKLMAKEFPGILLCIAAVLRSTAGRQLIMQKRRSKFTEATVKDWSLLVETLLQWETWLRSDKMALKHVEAAKPKHKFIMYLIKKVGRRQKGMGLKVFRFHTILHMVGDIINLGVPLEFDAGSCESGHKPTKNAAKLTQRSADTFDAQTARRLYELHLLELAIEEINGYPLTGCYRNKTRRCDLANADGDLTEASVKPTIFGGKIKACRGGTGTRFKACKVDAKRQNVQLEQALIGFLGELQEKVATYVPEVWLRTEHRRKGTIFRAHWSYRGAMWRGWAMVDWGNEGMLPCKLWGFVGLTGLPPHTGLNHGGANLHNAMFAVAECADMSENANDDVHNASIFQRISKEVGGFTHGLVPHLKFYLIGAEAFHGPAAVVAGLGGRPNECFLIKPRSRWREDFENWLAAGDEGEEISDGSDDECDEEIGNYAFGAENSESETENSGSETEE